MGIRLQFSDAPGIPTALIRWWSHGSFSHVDLVDEDGFLIGARRDGVLRRPPNYEAFRSTKIVEVACPRPEAALAFARSQIGKPYDWTAIFGFAAGRDWREDDSWFCSELAAAAIERAGAFVHRLCVPQNKLTPADLVLVLSAIADV